MARTGPSGRRGTLAAGFALALVCAGLARAEPWWPVSVESREPPFRADASFVRMEYTPLRGATRPWRLCGVIPSLAIEYYQAVAEGLRLEATRQGVALEIAVAGGFDSAPQVAQLSDCLDAGAQGLLIAASARTGFDGVLARAAAAGVVTVELATGLDSPEVTARIAPDGVAVGAAVGAYLAEQYPPGGDGASVVWMSAPPALRFDVGYDSGFRGALDASEIGITASAAAPSQTGALDAAVRALLDEAPQATAMAGVGAAIQAADDILGPRAFEMTLVATEIGARIVDSIAADRIDAAVNAMPVHQGRIAVDLAVRALEGLPFLADLRPTLEIVDGANVATFDRRGAIVAPD